MRRPPIRPGSTGIATTQAHSPEGRLLICVLTKHADRTSAAAKECIARIARYAHAYVRSE
jgi:hypothetical protein